MAQSDGCAPLVDRVGDVTGVLFPFEEHVALFIAGSSDVLLCGLHEWQKLTQATRMESNLAQSSSPDSDLELIHAPVNLTSMLSSLGALIS